MLVVGACALYVVVRALFFPACLCTAHFNVVTVNVVDRQHQPLRDVWVTVTQARTRTIYRGPSTGPVNEETGAYVIMDDNSLAELKRRRETVIVTLQRGTSTVTQALVIGTDGCGCHVAKISGPDTIVWPD